MLLQSRVHKLQIQLQNYDYKNELTETSTKPASVVAVSEPVATFLSTTEHGTTIAPTPRTAQSVPPVTIETLLRAAN